MQLMKSQGKKISARRLCGLRTCTQIGVCQRLWVGMCCKCPCCWAPACTTEVSVLPFRNHSEYE